MYDMKITTTRRVPFKRGPAVDIYLNEEDNRVLYERWGTGVTKYGWREPLSMRGGVSTITVEMLRAIPEKELKKVYFKKITERILEATCGVGIVP